MRLPRDSRFDDERARFALRFCCEACAHFDGLRELCAHGWPTADHRRGSYDRGAGEVVYCKEFELG